MLKHRVGFLPGNLAKIPASRASIPADQVSIPCFRRLKCAGLLAQRIAFAPTTSTQHKEVRSQGLAYAQPKNFVGFHLTALQPGKYDLLGKLEPYPLKVRLGEQTEILAGLSEGDMGMLIDLRPYMQRTPFIIQARLPNLQRLPQSLWNTSRALRQDMSNPGSLNYAPGLLMGPLDLKQSCSVDAATVVILVR